MNSELLFKPDQNNEDVLQHAYALSNFIIDLNPYGIQIFDAEGHHVRANRAFFNMFQSMPPANYCWFDDPIIAKAGFHEAQLTVKEGKTHVLSEVWYNARWLHSKLPDKLLCFRSTVFPIMNAEGKMEYFVVMFEDITELKRTSKKEKELIAAAEADHKRATELDKVNRELSNRSERSERFNRVTVDQELEMVRLEEEVNTLLQESGRPIKYETPEKIKK